ESTAEFYRELYKITEYHVLDERLLAKLVDSTGDALIKSIQVFFSGRQKSAAMIQVPDLLRRRLWEQIERRLYETGLLAHPIVVIGSSENPASPALQFHKAPMQIPLLSGSALPSDTTGIAAATN